jgi:MFS family permease
MADVVVAGRRGLGRALVGIAFLGAVIGGVGAPLITPVALSLRVSLDAAQWTLTVTLFAGAVAAPVLGRLGTGPHRRATIVGTLALVALGGALTTAPLPFAALLLGRALQGLGLGVAPLVMSVARDHLPADRVRGTIATVSVASTVGIGVAYPLIGLVDQLAGLRAAYGCGFALSAAAVLIAARALPPDGPRPPARVDVPGALLFGAGTFGLLYAIAEPSAWRTPWVGGAVLAGSAAAFAGWVVVERRVTAPLVDLGLVLRGTVLRANAAMFASGAALYLLFALLTRYLQTPAAAGYGFGLSGVLAGAALIPFSAFGFLAGKLTPRLRLPGRWAFAAHAAAAALAAALFAVAAPSLPATLAAMALLGFGVGGVSAVMPGLVLSGVPQRQTASVLSVNQIVRSTAFSIGSALAGLLLATPAPFPAASAYPPAALCAVPLLALGVLVGWSRAGGVAGR